MRDAPDTLDAARWEIVHACLSTLQEIGWYAGLEELKYPTSTLGDIGDGSFDGFFSVLAARNEPFQDTLRSWDDWQRFEWLSSPVPTLVLRPADSAFEQQIVTWDGTARLSAPRRHGSLDFSPPVA